MASLVLGLAGAAVGSAFGPFGASVGWALGSALGSTLDPQKTQGPRLSDLKLPTSQFGIVIPRVWGTYRVASQVIWQTDLTEHSQESGGKGGPTVTNYTYSASFAVMLCQGPILGVLKIWADARLVYDGNNAADFPFTLYLGDETQLADPTMEAALGAGNVPAFRGKAYLVFEDLDLTQFGNRLPALSALVTTGESTDFGRLTLFEEEMTPSRDGQPTNFSIGYDGERITKFRTIGNGIVNPEFSNNDDPFEVRFEHYDEFGVLLSVESTTYSGEYTSGGTNWYRAMNAPGWYFSFVNGPHRHGGAQYLWGDLWYGDTPIAVDQDWTICGTTWAASWDLAYGYMIGTNNFDSLGGSTVRKYPLAGFTTLGYVASFVIATGSHSPASFAVKIDTDGSIWIVASDHLWHLTADLELIFLWDWEAIRIATGSRPPAYFPKYGMFCNGRVTALGSEDGRATQDIYTITTSAPYLTLLGAIPYAEVPEEAGHMYNVGNGIGWVQDGLLAICGVAGGPVPLSEIVADLSESAGLDATQYDVEELTDLVDGFAIGQQMSARAAIEPLMAAYYFDAVESDARAIFPKRGRSSVATLAATDLGAYEAGSEPVSPLSRVRAQESDLPRQVDAVYVRADFDYQESSPPPAQRMTGTATETRTLGLPIVMSDVKAKQIVDVQLFNAWLERDRLSVSLPRKYARLVPTDVVLVDGKQYRTVQSDEAPYGPLKLSLVKTSAQSWYAGPAIGTGSGGSGPVEVVPKQLSMLEMLDVPYIAEDGVDAVYWAALAGVDRPEWAGAGIYKSTDGGVTYTLTATATGDPSTIGYATTILPDFHSGNIVDELSTVTVQLTSTAVGLSSTTRDELLAGNHNRAVLGAEILNYRDAVLVAENTYVLSGFMRGRRGTEWAMAMHTVGEVFTPIPAAARYDDIPAEYGVTTLWKAVTNGTTLAAATAVEFRSKGLTLLPYSPVQCGTGVNAAGEFLLTWRRRTRINGEWLNYVDVPLNETTEQYVVTLYTDSSCSTEVVRFSGINEQAFTVTADDQDTFFGGPQSELFWTVSQVGNIGPGFDSFGRAPILRDTESPVTPDATENVPEPGTDWHEDYTFVGGSPTNAEQNFNYLQSTYGPSWAFAYLWATRTAARARFLSEEGDDALDVLDTMGGARHEAPPGFLVPFGTLLAGGPYVPFGSPPLPLALLGYAGGLNPDKRAAILLPYDDNDET